MSAIYSGLTILLKYEPDLRTAAEHDEFFAGSTPPSKMSPEDVKELNLLGWMWDEELESWSRFT